MLGLMQQQPLLISSLLTHAARHHASAEVVSATGEGTTHHTTWAETERRARRLVRVLQGLGVKPQDRVGTLAWNDYRHLEIYYADVRHAGDLPHDQSAPRAGRHRLHHQPRRRQRAVRRSGLRAADRRHRRADHGQRARRGDDDRRGGHAGAGPAARHAPALLRRADGRGGRRLRLAELRREHRERALLHVGHHRAAEGRAVQPPLHGAPRLCDRAAGRAGPARHQPHPAGRADVPRQCLGHSRTPPR